MDSNRTVKVLALITDDELGKTEEFYQVIDDVDFSKRNVLSCKVEGGGFEAGKGAMLVVRTKKHTYYRQISWGGLVNVLHRLAMNKLWNYVEEDWVVKGLRLTEVTCEVAYHSCLEKTGWVTNSNTLAITATGFISFEEVRNIAD